MADINVERKEGTNWLWWILGLILLALLIWWLIPDGEEEVVMTEPAPIVEPMAPVAAPAVATGPTIGDVLANPGAFAGQSFSTSSVRVAEVASDRGFWIENNGQRMFVVKNESPEPGTADVQGAADVRPARDVNAGDMLQINGTLYASPDQIQPPLDQQTRQAMQGQPIFLHANVAEIQHMDGGATGS